jgi:CopG family transcriptional regulator / antitoxin EndoAI
VACAHVVVLMAYPVVDEELPRFALLPHRFAEAANCMEWKRTLESLDIIQKHVIVIHITSVYAETGWVMTKRLNITLPERTVALMDRVAGKGQRSRLIAEAVERYVEEEGRAKLRKRLREGAEARAGRDLELAEEWYALDEEVQPDAR